MNLARPNSKFRQKKYISVGSRWWTDGQDGLSPEWVTDEVGKTDPSQMCLNFVPNDPKSPNLKIWKNWMKVCSNLIKMFFSPSNIFWKLYPIWITSFVKVASWNWRYSTSKAMWRCSNCMCNVGGTTQMKKCEGEVLVSWKLGVQHKCGKCGCVVLVSVVCCNKKLQVLQLLIWQEYNKVHFILRVQLA